MASDSNLIRASFGLGQARAAADVPNMQELYKSQADLAMKPFQTIMGVMGEMKKEQKAFDLAKSKQLQPLKNNFNKMYQSLYSEKEPLPQSFINAIEGQVTMLKDEFEAVNTIGKGDTRENERARNRIMGKFTKLKNSVVNFRGNLMKISGAADNIDDKNFSSLDIDPITYVSDINKWDQYVASGDMQYSFDEGVIALTIKNYTVGEDLVRSGDAVTFNLEQMVDRLPQRPKLVEARIVQNTNNAKQSGSDAGGKEGAEKSDYKFDIDIATSRYNADLDDEKELQFLMKNAVTGIGGNSFHEDLLVSDIINLETAKLLGFDETYFKGLDKDGDGFITTDDSPLTETEKQAWKNNTRTIVDAITNRYNPNYNFELSKELYIFHQVDKERQTNERAYDIAHKRANPDLYKTTPTDDQSLVLGVYRKYKDQDAILDLASKGEPINDWRGWEWAPDPDKPGNYKGPNDISIDLTRLLKGENFGMTDRIRNRKLIFKGSDGNNMPIIDKNPIPFTKDSNIKSNLFSDQKKYKSTYDQLLNAAEKQDYIFSIRKDRGGKSLTIFEGKNSNNSMSLKFGLSVEDARKQMEEFNNFIQGLNK
tara:strand:+ start:71 stop:1852 length:1782 start_codon:yes stop_codon:yes gene_type:complete